MDWFREHLVLVYGIGVGLLILAGVVLISDKLAMTPAQSADTWGTLGIDSFQQMEFEAARYQPRAEEERFTIADLYRNLESNPDRFYASLNPENAPKSGTITGSTTAEGYFEYDTSAIDALLATLKPTTALTTGEGGGANLKDIYSYIPTSIMGTTTRTEETMSETQFALYDYGNEAGGSIQTYFTLYGSGQAQIFKNFIEDRKNPEKAGQARAVAEGLIEVGESLERMEVIPSQIGSRHQALYEAYKVIGNNLIKVTESTTDNEIVSAMEKYNASVDDFARKYLAIVTVLSANGVTFRNEEPGSVFVFTPIQIGEEGF